MGWTRPMRVLMIASEGPPIRSGIARSIKRLTEGLTARGHHVDVLAHPEVPRAIFGEVRLSGLAFRLFGLRQRLETYDVVHVHGAVPTFSDVFLLFARARARGGRGPVIVYTHHCDVAVGPFALPNQVYNAAHRRLAAIVADAVVATTVGYAADERTWVIPLGVDPERFAPNGRKDPGFTVLFVGQFRPYKGARVLIRAMSQVRDARLLLAGHGPEATGYQKLGADLGVNLELHVGSSDAELRDLYGRAHAVVLPSINRAEAFGLVLLEGMSAGCVPVASDLTGVREVLGRIGFTFEPGNVDELADTLRLLRDSPQLVAEVARRARARVESFTWDRTIEGYERLFRSLVVGRGLEREVGEHASSSTAVPGLAHAMATMLEADEASVWLAPAGTAVVERRFLAARWPRPADEAYAALIADYAFANHEHVLVGPGECPIALAGHMAEWPRSAVAVPLTRPGEGYAFGVLLAVRDRPFDWSDREALRMLAQHTAAPLWTFWRGSTLHQMTDRSAYAPA